MNGCRKASELDWIWTVLRAPHSHKHRQAGKYIHVGVKTRRISTQAHLDWLGLIHL